MGQVIISPNIKSERVRIDHVGNEIDPKTKQIIKFKEEEYKPTKEEIERVINLPKEPAKIPELNASPVPVQNAPANNPLANMIQKKVEEAVAASLAKIDISKMVEDAINQAFK